MFNKSQIGGLIILPLIATVACTSAHVSEPSACKSDTVDFGPVPKLPSFTGSIPFTVSKDVTVDFSDTVKKVSDVVSNLSIKVTNLTLNNNGDLNWVNSIDVKITGSDSSMPAIELATADSALEFTVVANSATVLRYFKSGSVTLTFTASGTVSESTLPSVSELVNNYNVCLAVSGDFNKSL